MADNRTTVAELRAEVDAFVAARDWRQFHNPKDLAISIAIEAAELMEEFQWLDAEQVAALDSDSQARERIRFELADVLIYCLSLGNVLGGDLADTIRAKLVMAGHKYPVDAYRGRARKPGQSPPPAGTEGEA